MRGISLMLMAIWLIVIFPNSSESKEKSCKAAVSAMMKVQMGLISKCTKKLNLKGKEKAEKMNCIMKCVMIQSGLMKEDGGIEIENAMQFVLLHIPLDYLEKALKGSLKCQRYMQELDVTDPLCKSYEPLVKCITGFAMQLCSKN